MVLDSNPASYLLAPLLCAKLNHGRLGRVLATQVQPRMLRPSSQEGRGTNMVWGCVEWDVLLRTPWFCLCECTFCPCDASNIWYPNLWNFLLAEGSKWMCFYFQVKVNISQKRSVFLGPLVFRIVAYLAGFSLFWEPCHLSLSQLANGWQMIEA